MSLTLITTACDGRAHSSAQITPEYDKKSGKLQLLKYDSDGDGKVDTWSYMDGARVVRIEIDKDQDGRIDRWEYYTADQKLEKVGFSRLKDGKEDAWSFTGPDGALERIEVSTRRDGKVTRTEHYRGDVITAAEEDTDGDGVLDKWEVYEGERLASVAFDNLHRGTPDRRLIYGSNGNTRFEVDEKGDGHFVRSESQAPVAAPHAALRPPQ